MSAGCETQSHTASVTAHNTFYVATTGNDNNPGTLAQPWLTIQRAANVAVAGDTINIVAGTYNGPHILMQNSGSAGNYITFQNYNSGTVNINITDSNWIGISTNAKNYLKFSGLRISAPNNFYGIDAYQSSYITIQNCYFTNCKADGIYGENASYITIDNCEVTGVGTASSEEMISMYSVAHFEIKNCLVHDSAGTQRIGIDAKNGSSNGSIHNNTVYDTGANGIYVDARGIASNIDIYNNLVYNCPLDSGIAVNDENGTGSLTNINIYNNIIYGCREAFQICQTGTETYTNISFINNTCYNNNILGSWHPEIYISTKPAYTSNLIIRNNIIVETAKTNTIAIYDGNNDYANGMSVDHNLFYNSTGTGWLTGITSDNVFGTNAIQANPLLVNPPTNFALSAGSPAINTGASTNAPATDYIGTSRLQGAGIDIGAYEH